jgi:hypothetical protein
MFHRTTITNNRFVVKYGETNKETLLVELVGKKRALKAAGFPTDLPPATPEQSRWGKVIGHDEAKALLGI